MAPQALAADPTLLALYASTADAALWPRALDRLCSDTGACSAVVQAFRFDDGRARVLWTMQDSRTGAQRAVPSHGVVDDGNPRLDPRRALRGLNRIASDDQPFDAGDTARPRLQQQLATLGLGRFIGTLQDAGSGVYVGLALHRSIADRNDFSASQVGRMLQAALFLMPAALWHSRAHAPPSGGASAHRWAPHRDRGSCADLSGRGHHRGIARPVQRRPRLRPMRTSFTWAGLGSHDARHHERSSATPTRRASGAWTRVWSATRHRAMTNTPCATGLTQVRIEAIE
jgi:hypothetical protein